MRVCVCVCVLGLLYVHDFFFRTKTHTYAVRVQYVHGSTVEGRSCLGGAYYDATLQITNYDSIVDSTTVCSQS